MKCDILSTVSDFCFQSNSSAEHQPEHCKEVVTEAQQKRLCRSRLLAYSSKGTMPMRIGMVDEEAVLSEAVLPEAALSEAVLSEAMLTVVTRILCHLEVEEIENISSESIWAAASSRNKVIMDPELIRNALELSPNLLCLINLNDFKNDCCSREETLHLIPNTALFT